jgi:hypothetical protein
MDSNFQVKVSADVSELYKSLQQVADAMTKLDGVTRDIGKAADYAASNMSVKLGTATKEMANDAKTASVSIGNLNKTFQESNDKAGRARLAAFAFGQVIRDAGFFSQSFGLGLLAISNNIPILIDQLVLLSGVSAGVGTALSLVGSILTAALTVWAYSSNAVDKNKQSIDEWRTSLDDTVESQLKGKQAALDEVTSLDVLYRATTNLANSYETRLAAAKQLQEQYPTTFGNLSAEAIAAGKAASAYNELRESIISAAMAEAAKDKIVENASRILDNNTKITQTQIALQKKKLALLQEETKYNKEFEAAAKAMTTTAGKEGVDPFAAANRSLANQAALKKEIAALEKVINNATTDTTILNERNTALTGEIDKNVKGYVASMSDGKAAKSIKTIADVYEELRIKLLQIDADTTLSTEENAKKKVSVYRSAQGEIIEITKSANGEQVKSLGELTAKFNSIANQQKNLAEYYKNAPLTGFFESIVKSVGEVDKSYDKLAVKFQQIDSVQKDTFFDKAPKYIQAFQATINELLANGVDPMDRKIQLLQMGIANLSTTTEGFNNMALQSAQMLAGPLSGAFEQMLTSGTFSFSSLTKVIGDMVKRLIAAAMAAFLLSTILKGITGGAMGGAGGKGGFKDIFGTISGLKMANGGIASGPTQALIGEYPGAKTNPEVVAPLDKLQGILANTMGGSSQGPATLQTRISGNDLVILMERANKNRNGYF